MTAAVVLAEVVTRPVAAAELVTLVHCDRDGAVVTFEGIVRDHDGGRSVVRLGYEAHPTATERLADAARSTTADHPGVTVAALHRVGELVVGDVALAVAVASAHRQAAFEACSALVDRIKADVPIWKRQDFADGTDEWVGSL